MDMSWIEHLGEPLCRTREEAEQYITTELKQAVPKGWKVKRIMGPRHAWTIARDVIPSGEWPDQEYSVQISAGLDLIIFTHDNNDRGPLWAIQCALQNALVIDSSALREVGMAACISRLLAECHPNEWGYT